MQIKYELRHSKAQPPYQATAGAAGFDLVATTKEESQGIITYGTGLAVAIPEGYVGLLFPRSSVYKTGLMLCNSVGVIDSDYRGEIMLKFAATYMDTEFGPMIRGLAYEVGDRVGQLVIMPVPQVTFEEGYLDDTDRGEGGFGSTNKVFENTYQRGNETIEETCERVAKRLHQVGGENE